MKVLFVHDFYQQHGGEDACANAERMLLQATGHEIIAYTRDNSEIADYGVLSQLALPLNSIYSMRTKREITRLFGTLRPDLAYIHNFFPLISPSLYHTLHSLNVPCVQVLHDFRFLCPNGWFYINGRICDRCKHGNYTHAVRQRCYRDSYAASAVAAAVMAVNRAAGVLNKIDAYVCVSDFVRQVFHEAGVPKEKLFVKPNFLDTSNIVPNFTPGQYALYLGRLSNEKGIRTLLDTWEQLPDVPLKIAGAGPCESEIRSHIAQKGLDHIELLGFKTGDEKSELLGNSAFLVVPSVWYETFGQVVLESYAAGKPVIASRTGGLQELVCHNKTGLLFTPGNVDKLLASVRFLLSNPQKICDFGRNGRKLVETRFGPGQSIETLSRIFSTVVCGAVEQVAS